MRNLLIITPFYPFPDFNWIKKDSKVVYYLTKNKPDDVNIIIVYYYQSTRINSFKALNTYIKNKTYKDCLYRDDRGNDVLFFEHPCIIPMRSENIHCFDRINISLLNEYLHDKSIDIDCVVTHFPSRYSYFAKLISAKCHCAIFHSFDVKSSRNIKIVRKALDVYDIFGFRSKNIEDECKKFIPDYSNTFLCLSGIPQNIYSGAIRQDWKKNGTLKITTVGRLDENKNVLQVLKALSLLDKTLPISLIIIGDGPTRLRLEQYVSNNNLVNVEFKGAIPRDKVFDYLINRDLFIMTSFKETLGLAYLESLAMGNIVIGSKHQGVYGLFSENDGCYFVNPRSSEELASLIKSIFSLSLSDVIKSRINATKKLNLMSDENSSNFYFSKVLPNVK